MISDIPMKLGNLNRKFLIKLTDQSEIPIRNLNAKSFLRWFCIDEVEKL
jgi:hypothetical protein